MMVEWKEHPEKDDDVSKTAINDPHLAAIPRDLQTYVSAAPWSHHLSDRRAD